MNNIFYLGFAFCLFGYSIHTVFHYLEYKGHMVTSKTLEIFLHIVIFLGYAGWSVMLVFDPVEINMSDFFSIFLGALFGIPGLILFFTSSISKKGYKDVKKLITTGIYSRLRNPMYLGIILIHIGIPLSSKSLLTLISAVLWIPQLLLWKHWEEKELEERFGKKYLDYKKKTWF